MKPLDIVLIEDEVSTIELLKEAFRDSGMNVDLEVHHNGDAALKALRSRQGSPPQIILLDLNLPGKSGIDILKELKQGRDTKVIPVIILTNSQSSEDVLRAYANHANAYIRKPMGFDQLVEVLNHTGKFWIEVATTPSEVNSKY